MENKVLEVLVNAGKPLRPGDIAKELGVDSKEVSKAIAELKKEGKNPFTLDSKEPTGNFREFLLSEVRYSSLQRTFPEIAEELFEQTEATAKERLEGYKKLAQG